MSNLALKLVKTDYFEGNKIDFYKGNQEFYLTRNQIGKALNYAKPTESIQKIHDRHTSRLNKFSTKVRLGLVEGNRTVTRSVITYSYRGLCEICRYSEQPKADLFMDWVWDIIEKLQNNQTRMSAEEVINISSKNEYNHTHDILQQVLSKLNNLEDQFSDLQQEKIIDTQTIHTLEHNLIEEKRQIHKKPISEKRNRICEDLKANLFYNEFNNPKIVENYNKALNIVQSTYIKDIFKSIEFTIRKQFSSSYNSLEWAVYVLGVGYTILHSANDNIYYNIASKNILFSKKVDDAFCDEYLDLDSPAEKNSFLYKNIISEFPQMMKYNKKVLQLYYSRSLDLSEKRVYILLNPTHMKIDSSISLNEYLIMLDMSIRKITEVLYK